MQNNTNKNVIDLGSARAIKEYIENSQLHIQKLEHALYEILDTKSIDQCKELAADALGEDLDTYLEEDDLAELDFEDDGKVPWSDIPEVEVE